MMCFIRINPSSAPLNPPGAAPTLTTIYQTNSTHLPSAFKSQSSTDSSKTATTTTSERTTTKRKNRLGWNNGKPTPASAAIEGTAKEKKRMQEIADSLDLGLEVEEGKIAASKRVEGAAGHALDREPNRVVGKGDLRLERRKETIGMGEMRVERRRETIGMGDLRFERRSDSVAMVLPVGSRRSVG